MLSAAAPVKHQRLSRGFDSLPAKAQPASRKRALLVCGNVTREAYGSRCRSCGLAPKCSHRRSLRCLTNGGSIDVAVSGEDTSIRPGSWNTAKARDGTSGDLRDPIRVHVREAGAGRPATTKGPGLEASLRASRSAKARHEREEESRGLRKRTNKRLWIREWEVVVPS